MCKMAVDLLPFCILLFIIAPTAHACSYFESLIVSLSSMSQGDFCPDASTLVIGPSSQPYLIMKTLLSILMGVSWRGGVGR